jgi:hypothetical protein
MEQLTPTWAGNLMNSSPLADMILRPYARGRRKRMRKRAFDLAAESDLERPQVRDGEEGLLAGFNLSANALVKTGDNHGLARVKKWCKAKLESRFFIDPKL